MQSTIIPKCIYKKISRIFLIVKAKPGSKKQGISVISDEVININIKSPPVDGKANIELICYLADIFDLSKSDVTLEKGGSNKNKIISISDVYSEEEVLNILNENLL